MSARVLVSQPIPERGLELLRREGIEFEINSRPHPLPKAELISALAGKEGLICLLTDRIDAELIERATLLRGIANCAVGYDNIDLDAAAARGIFVTNTPDVLTETTADLTWALILSVARRIAEADRFTRNGLFRGWEMMLLLGGDVHGKLLGIVGAGRIGMAVARRARGFAMRILYCNPHRNHALEEELGAEPAPLDRLLEESDFVSLHVPLLPETRHLIGERELSRMKKSAYLINTSRGPVVDEAALVRFLREGRISGAGLDVYENEPKLSEGLRNLDNVVLLPHIGSASFETRSRMAEIAALNIAAILRGEPPPHRVNPFSPQPSTL
ncbi:MAG: D-glycerate dehydrogenase [Candidatus Aureabacteria bacterium]|nr:D-glycerate dehydrogenase [Candidatus Auribacterota bacterium]